MPRPPTPAPAPSFVYKTKTLTRHLTRPLALLAMLGGCSLQAASEPAPASVQTQTQALTPLTGMADLHLHMFGEEAFGGGWLHGSATAALNRCDGGMPPSSHARVRQDMRDLLKLCPSTGGLDLSSVPILAQIFAAGGGVTSELLAKTDATDGDTGLHLGQVQSQDATVVRRYSATLARGSFGNEVTLRADEQRCVIREFTLTEIDVQGKCVPVERLPPAHQAELLHLGQRIQQAMSIP